MLFGCLELLVVLVVLHLHIFELKGQKLAVALTDDDDLGGREGVDMHLDAHAVAHRDDGFAVLLQCADKVRKAELMAVLRRVHQLQNKFHAVAVLKGAVLVKQVKIHLHGRHSRRRIGGHGLAAQPFEHAVGNGDKAQRTAVHHACLLEYRQQLGRAQQRAVHLFDIERQKPLHIGVGCEQRTDVLDALARDRENGSLGRLDDRVIGSLAAACQRVAQRGGVELRTRRQRSVEALEKLREDHARIAARTEQHALAEPFEVGAGVRFGSGVADAVRKRQPHIGAGVAVGNGKHIEAVDLRFTCLQLRQTVFYHLFQLGAGNRSCVHTIIPR